MNRQAEKSAEKLRNKLLLIMPILLMIWTGVLMGLECMETIRQWALQPDNLLLIGLVTISLIVLSAMTPLPSEAIAATNGMIFGPLLGTLITWIAALLGAYLVYAWCRQFRREIPLPANGKINWDKVNYWMEKWGVLGFLIARLSPAVPFFAMNIGAAFMPISKRTFLLITAVAIIPYALIFNFLGAQLIDI